MLKAAYLFQAIQYVFQYKFVNTIVVSFVVDLLAVLVIIIIIYYYYYYYYYYYSCDYYHLSLFYCFSEFLITVQNLFQSHLVNIILYNN